MKSVLPNLYPLRFILAAFVILEHSYGLCATQGLIDLDGIPMLDKGYEAVCMFFALSGFLIIRIIYQEKEDNRFSIRYFYTRRALRILPVYFLVSGFGLFYYNFLLPTLGIPFEINYNIGEAILMLLFLVPNLLATYEPGGILEVLWSIGVEEQFYLIIPVLLFLVKKKHVLKLLIAAFLGYFYLYHLSDFSLPRNYGLVYFFLLSGGIVGALDKEGKLDFFKRKPLPSVLILLMTIIVFVTDIFDFDTRAYDLFMSLLFGITVFVLGCANHGIVIRQKLIDYFGKISYGIYMYHTIVINAVVFILLKTPGLYRIEDRLLITCVILLVTFISIVGSHFSYTYFERYFIRKMQKYRPH